MIVAAVDCGTNSVRLLVAETVAGTVAGTVAEATGDGLRELPGPHELYELHELYRAMRIVRLGQDVDRTGRLAPEALERTEAALAEYAATVARFRAERVRLVATSATRDASNRGDFEAMVRRVLGVPADVVSGADEAALSFAGAAGVAGPEHGPLVVLDIGGGSTELVRGGDGSLRAHSMDVGAVRMTERHLTTDPPGAAQVAAVEADVRAALAASDVPLDPGVTLIGVAGTVTTVAALASGLEHYERDVIHGAVLTRARIEDVTDRLVRSTADERAAMSVIHPGRRDVITGGALILRTLVHEIGVDALLVSEHDILDGIAQSLVAEPRG